MDIGFRQVTGLAVPFEAVFENALDAICLHRDGVHVLVNPAYARLFGYETPAAMIGLSVMDTVCEDMRPVISERVERRKRGEKVDPIYITRGMRADGSTFDVEIHASSFTVAGEALILAICRDATGVRDTARRLEESELRMRTLFDLSPDASSIIQHGRFVECNAAAVQILGYTSKADLLQRTPASISPARQPDGIESKIKAASLAKLADEQGVCRFEWLYARADGSEFLAEVTAAAIGLGGQSAYFCTWRDVTARRQAETELQLAASVFHSTRDGVLITDRNGSILSVNPAFTEITGYTADDVIGKNPRILKSNHHPQEFYSNMWNTLLATGAWQGEVWNRRKDGEAYLESLTITAIVDSNHHHVRFVSVFSDITELHRKDEKIRHQAYHDALTDLPNRSLLGDRLQHAIDLARRHRGRVAVLFLDLDRFKVINDSLGHLAGDVLLQQVALRIQEAVRRSDTVGRLGGDEFLVLLSDFDAVTEVAQVAEKIIAALAQPFFLDDHQVQTGTSIGIAVFPQDGDDAATLIKNADMAMYQAKTAARGTFRFFDASMNLKAVERMELEAGLRRAVAGGEFVLFYQPKIHSPSGGVIGAEALIRWRRPDGRLIPPTEFIPVAEETGLIVPMGYWVLENVCRQMAVWQARDLPPITVSVNLSPAQFGDPALADRIEAIIGSSPIAYQWLELELTESTVMRDPATAIQTLNRLRKLGLRVSVDDFGAGYSSLSYLRRLPVDTIKIDRSFIADLGANPGDLTIVRAIVGLAGNLGLDVVAEGVETHGQLESVVGLGCEVIQGFYFSPPLDPDDFQAWLARRA